MVYWYISRRYVTPRVATSNDKYYRHKKTTSVVMKYCRNYFSEGFSWLYIKTFQLRTRRSVSPSIISLNKYVLRCSWKRLNWTVRIEQNQKEIGYGQDYLNHNGRPTHSIVSKSHRTLTVKRHQDDNQSKATSFLFLVKIIAKIERTPSNA